jgi:formylglycine-generating enzyme required for sulfatase activity
LEFDGNLQTCPTPDHPMGGTNWYDAVRFCRWLGKQCGLSEDDQPYPDAATLDPEQHPADSVVDAQGAPMNWPVRLDRRGFRLPTEHEWEIACRADTGSTYGFGSDATLLNRYAWFVGNSDGGGHLPRELRPNLRGLFDMHGNVMEWCHDWDDQNAISNTIDPVGASAGEFRVSRGGGWLYEAALSRSSARVWDIPSSRYATVGLRVAFVP